MSIDVTLPELILRIQKENKKEDKDLLTAILLKDDVKMNLYRLRKLYARGCNAMDQKEYDKASQLFDSLYRLLNPEMSKESGNDHDIKRNSRSKH